MSLAVLPHWDDQNGNIHFLFILAELSNRNVAIHLKICAANPYDCSLSSNK